MSLYQLLLLTASLWSQTLAVPTKPQCDAGPANEWLPQLWGYEPALEYCSSNYPLAPVTVTVIDQHTVPVVFPTVTQTQVVPHVLAPWTKTVSTKVIATVTATTTDWNNPVSTW